MTRDKLLKEIAETYSIVTTIQSKLRDLRYKLDVMEQELLCYDDEEEEDEDGFYELTPRGEFMVELINKGLTYEDAQAITDKLDWSDQ